MLWQCTKCGSAYSVGAPLCPECGMTCDGAVERDDYMARVNVHGNPTDRLRPELKRGDDVSLGNSLEASPEKRETSQSKSESQPHPRAGKTGSRSSKGPRGSNTADSADVSTGKG